MKNAMSLRLRITLFLAVAIVLTLGATTWLIDARVDTEVAQRADANILERAQALSDMLHVQRDGNRTEFPAGSLPAFLADDGVVYFTIDCTGQRIAASRSADRLPWPAAIADKPVYADLTDPQGTALRAIVMPFVAQPGLSWGKDFAAREAAMHEAGRTPPACSLSLALDHSEVENFQRTMDAIFIGSILLAIVVVVVLVPLLVARGLRPLTQLAETMREIGPETPERRLAETGVHELLPLTARFNEVLSRMQGGLLRERQFASGVAHELRTPLAELRTLIEVELRYPSTRDPRVLLADIGAIGVEMERMVGALLLLTRIEAGIEHVQWQDIDIARLTRKLVERVRGEMDTRRLELDMQIVDGVVWPGDIALLDVLLGNLVSNAAAYAPAGSRILLRCESRAWWIENDAPRLAAEDIAMMQRRFWRQGEDAGVHTGLGLALATAAAQIQSMQLELTLREQRLCARVSLDIPAARAFGPSEHDLHPG